MTLTRANQNIACAKQAAFYEPSKRNARLTSLRGGIHKGKVARWRNVGQSLGCGLHIVWVTFNANIEPTKFFSDGARGARAEERIKYCIARICCS